jgi:phospholipid/cholesterol/gamma-HCH transport system substrate-binding protein
VRKQAPTFGRLLVLCVFALTCFTMLLYLWFAFGGPIPLESKGYRITIPFDEAGQLSAQADVRISGVPVGKVESLDYDKDRGVTDAVVQLDRSHAPLPADTRAILRQKTLLGETYIEISPGTPGGATIPEGGRLTPAAVGTSVELDEIFRALDARTRKNLTSWLQRQAQAVDGRGRDISDALGNLAPTSEDATDLLTVLDAQSGAVSRLVANAGVVAGAIGDRGGQLQALVNSADRVFATTARRDAELEQVLRVLPVFETETRTTLRALTEFGEDADPLVSELRPAARELTPTLQAVERVSPAVRNLFEALGPLVDASEDGLPAISSLLREVEPLLGQLDPWLREVNPPLAGLGLFKNELNAFFANIAALTQAVNVPDGNTERRLHYLRGGAAINVGALAPYPIRIGSNRGNPYPFPGIANSVPNQRVFEARGCGRGDPSITTDADPALLPDDLRALIAEFAYGGHAADDVPAPPCIQQPAFPSLGSTCAGEAGDYPHVCPDARPRP